MPPKPNPSLYSISKTFVWFALMSILLTGSLVAIVWLDYDREWKKWQKQFVSLKAEKVRKELEAAEAGVDKKKLEELQKSHAKAVKQLESRIGESDTLRKDIAALETRIAKARARYQDQKQFQDSYKYYFEEYGAHHDPRQAEYKKKLDEITPVVEGLKLELEKLEKERDDKTARLESFGAEEKDVERQIAKLLEEKTRQERRLKAVEPSVAKDVLNAPMLDFVAPTLKVQQIVLEDLQDDYHFARVQKVDRCTTCHLGIDQKGFEDAPQPFRTHPNMDLYLGSASPHPIEKIGCTVCHGGNGHSVSFKDSAHTPRDEKQAEEWRKKHGWAELHKWEAKMLPLQFTQAACAKCHQAVHEVPQAEKLNAGRRIAEEHGCFNCHKIGGFEERWKVGPSLENVKSKLDPEWIAKWIDDPTDFRPSTEMPRVFHLSNTSSPEDIEKNNASIRAITAYLVKHSSEVALTKPAATGDAGRGETLVKEIGCTGCHTVGGLDHVAHGPELNGMGSKVAPEWLYTWLKDPKHYSKETRMPSLRLTDQEAADITAYLMSMKNDEFDKKPVPEAKPEVVDALILESLQGTMRKSEAQAELDKMSAAERLEFLGKKAIGHQGCFSCHTIKGFEDAKPIGTELTTEGSKDIHQFDFGFVHIDHTRHAFIAQKLKDPRIFDHGKVRGYYEKLRMPQFHLTDEEIEHLTTFVLSLTDERIPLEMQAKADPVTERGRLLVAKLNCQGCHTLDGKTGVLREKTEDLGSAPPTLVGEGAKVQEKWLHDFLHAPTTIRPWLKYRMPTFGFTEEELNDLVAYFNSLSDTEPVYGGYSVKADAETLAAGKKLFDSLQCVKCHQISAETAAMGASFLAPDLSMTKDRLKPNWVHAWITDPQALEEGTMMPTFFPDGSTAIEDVLGGDAQKQISAIRDYLYAYEKPQEA